MGATSHPKVNYQNFPLMGKGKKKKMEETGRNCNLFSVFSEQRATGVLGPVHLDA